MRILASGDHHFDEHSRFEECINIHAWMVGQAHELQVDLFLSGGDIFERGSSPVERAAVADWLADMAAICPVIIAKGNHEKPLDAAFMERIRARHPICVHESVGVNVIGDVAIGSVAWPNRGALAAAVEKPMAGEALDQVARHAYRAIFAGLGETLAQHAGPKILLTHCMADGAVTSTGQPLIGAELNIGLDDLALARADLVICGHIHKPQEWSHAGVDILYTGSPRRTAFGEVEDKSIVLVSSEGGRLTWERIKTPCAPMLLFDAEWNGTALVGPHRLADVTGAECRLRYSVPADQREAAAARAKEDRDCMVANGAIVVKLDEVVEAAVRARVPEVAAAETLPDKLRALWKAKGIELGDREPRVLGRLAELEV